MKRNKQLLLSHWPKISLSRSPSTCEIDPHKLRLYNNIPVAGPLSLSHAGRTVSKNWRIFPEWQKLPPLSTVRPHNTQYFHKWDPLLVGRKQNIGLRELKDELLDPYRLSFDTRLDRLIRTAGSCAMWFFGNGGELKIIESGLTVWVSYRGVGTSKVFHPLFSF